MNRVVYQIPCSTSGATKASQVNSWAIQISSFNCWCRESRVRLQLISPSSNPIPNIIIRAYSWLLTLLLLSSLIFAACACTLRRCSCISVRYLTVRNDRCDSQQAPVRHNQDTADVSRLLMTCIVFVISCSRFMSDNLRHLSAGVSDKHDSDHLGDNRAVSYCVV